MSSLSSIENVARDDITLGHNVNVITGATLAVGLSLLASCWSFVFLGDLRDLFLTSVRPNKRASKEAALGDASFQGSHGFYFPAVFIAVASRLVAEP